MKMEASSSDMRLIEELNLYNLINSIAFIFDGVYFCLILGHLLEQSVKRIDNTCRLIVCASDRLHRPGRVATCTSERVLPPSILLPLRIFLRISALSEQITFARRPTTFRFWTSKPRRKMFRSLSSKSFSSTKRLAAFTICIVFFSLSTCK